MKRYASLAVCVAWCACCSTTSELVDGRYQNDTVSYRIGEPGAGWHALEIKQSNLAWANDELAASMLVNSHCEGVADSPLEGLTNDLLMGTTEREIVKQEKLAWSKREALETTARAKLDGVERSLKLFVLKKDGCVYDIVLDADPAHFEEASAAYTRVRDRFDVEPRRDHS